MASTWPRERLQRAFPGPPRLLLLRPTFSTVTTYLPHALPDTGPSSNPRAGPMAIRLPGAERPPGTWAVVRKSSWNEQASASLTKKIRRDWQGTFMKAISSI